MQYRIRLSKHLRQTLIEQLERAYQAAQLRLVKRIHALLYLVDGKSVAEVSQLLRLGEQTIARLSASVPAARHGELALPAVTRATAAPEPEPTKGVSDTNQRRS